MHGLDGLNERTARDGEGRIIRICFLCIILDLPARHPSSVSFLDEQVFPV